MSAVSYIARPGLKPGIAGQAGCNRSVRRPNLARLFVNASSLFASLLLCIFASLRRCVKAELAVVVFLLATFAHASDSQFLFDDNGNLVVQSANVNAPPQITGQPQNRVVGSGETASFSVVAKGALPLTFQWQFNGTDIGGATGDALFLQNVSTNNEGQYSVVVSNASGSVTSAPALLAIDDDHDGMGDSWELFYFGNLDQNASRDFDDDGSSNLEEFRNGTDPTDPSSFAFFLTVITDAGTVIKTPDQRVYTNGQTVTLTAIPPPQWRFSCLARGHRHAEQSRHPGDDKRQVSLRPVHSHRFHLDESSERRLGDGRELDTQACAQLE